MLQDLLKAIGQLPDKRFTRVIGISLAATTTLFVLLLAGLWVLLSETTIFETGFFASFLEWITDIGAGLAALLLTLMLFPGISIIITGLLLDRIAHAVEARHYPDLPAPRKQPVFEITVSTLRLAMITIVLNLIALPFYLVLIFLPPLNLVVFYGINGHLLGREYFELVALRRIDAADMRQLRRRWRPRVWLVGAAIAFMFTVPLVNFIAPVLATAWMVHMFERLRSRGVAD